MSVSSAAVSVALIGLVMWRVLPRFAVHSTLSYPQLMASMAHLWQRYPALRRAALAQGALSIAFSAFWSTLAVMLSEHYHMGSAVAGGFGIAGAAGALAATQLNGQCHASYTSKPSRIREVAAFSTCP